MTRTRSFGGRHTAGRADDRQLGKTGTAVVGRVSRLLEAGFPPLLLLSGVLLGGVSLGCGAPAASPATAPARVRAGACSDAASRACFGEARHECASRDPEPARVMGQPSTDDLK